MEDEIDDGNNDDQNEEQNEKEIQISNDIEEEKKYSDKNDDNEKEDLPEEQEENGDKVEEKNNAKISQNINDNEEEQENEETIEKKKSKEKKDSPQETINIQNEMKNEELEYSSDDEEEEELSSEEEEYNDKSKESNTILSQNDNKNDIKIHYSQRKPLKIVIYSNLLQKMIDITNKIKNKINEKERNDALIHTNNLNQYMKELEDKIILMKKGYIKTLVEKHFEKNKNNKKEIILKANIPKKRNEVKKIFKELVGYIKDKLKAANQKYYYILILNILKKYKSINKDEMNEEVELYKKQKRNARMNNKNKNRNEVKEKEKIQYNYDDYNWISEQNKKRGMSFYIFGILIPLAYVINFVFANNKV